MQFNVSNYVESSCAPWNQEVKSSWVVKKNYSSIESFNIFFSSPFSFFSSFSTSAPTFSFYNNLENDKLVFQK